MKILIASDLHGSAKYCRLLLDAFKREGAEKLVLLGDVLYHGPRNPLPEDYNPQSVIHMLSEVSNKIICVRGNCDAEIDLQLLPFPVPDYFALFVDGINIYISHGHRTVPNLCEGDVYITGHTHVPLNDTAAEGYFHLNPGSLSLPKEESKHGYILYNNRKFVFKTLDGENYDSLEIDNGSAEIKHSAVVRRKIIRKKR